MSHVLSGHGFGKQRNYDACTFDVADDANDNTITINIVWGCEFHDEELKLEEGGIIYIYYIVYDEYEYSESDESNSSCMMSIIGGPAGQPQCWCPNHNISPCSPIYSLCCVRRFFLVTIIITLSLSCPSPFTYIITLRFICIKVYFQINLLYICFVVFF